VWELKNDSQSVKQWMWKSRPPVDRRERGGANPERFFLAEWMLLRVNLCPDHGRVNKKNVAGADRVWLPAFLRLPIRVQEVIL
jgi:hypothetical protein